MTQAPEKRLFCFGLGYSARALAADVIAAGWAVAGTCRSPEKADRTAALGAAPFRFDSGRALEDPQSALAGTTHLLCSIAPDDKGDPALLAHRDAISRLSGLRWIGYLSSTSVYGDRGGAMVDETAELQPVSARARRRVRAEDQWRVLWREHGLPVHFFRLAGIYGPGRGAIENVRNGAARRIDKPGHLFSRIHVADIVAVLRASMARPRPGAIYNVCDDHPAPSADVTAYACRLLAVAPPPLIPFAEAAQSMSPAALEFWADDRRISNARLHDELGVRLQYPSYREGLAANLADD
ncbi:MAG: SDR family oxidoreductase [Alphaproteobacteria bacterium]|jgi:nucleoside-diphosphate-sugar epimerase|nr:SDR family oxidoreductase [Alphaproteobacteria bacterium]